MELQKLNHLFDVSLAEMDNFKFQNMLMYIPTFAHPYDTYGLIAQYNINTFRDKFKKLFN